MKTEVTTQVNPADETIEVGDYYIGRHTGDLFLHTADNTDVTVAIIGGRPDDRGLSNYAGRVWQHNPRSVGSKVKKVFLNIEVER